MNADILSPELTVAACLTRWPQAIAVFFRHRLYCVGCDMSRFDTLADVVDIYGLDLDTFLAELGETIEGPETPPISRDFSTED